MSPKARPTDSYSTIARKGEMSDFKSSFLDILERNMADSGKLDLKKITCLRNIHKEVLAGKFTDQHVKELSSMIGQQLFNLRHEAKEFVMRGASYGWKERAKNQVILHNLWVARIFTDNARKSAAKQLLLVPGILSIGIHHEIRLIQTREVYQALDERIRRDQAEALSSESVVNETEVVPAHPRRARL